MTNVRRAVAPHHTSCYLFRRPDFLMTHDPAPNATPRFPDRWIIAVVVAFGALALLTLNDVLIYTPDSARYLVWANSLAQFRGFEDLSIPEPFHYVVHAPLYPVLLAPAALLFPSSIIAAKILTAGLGVGLLLLFHLWMRRLYDPPVPIVATALLSVHPLMLLFSHQVLSEIPFGLAVIGALFLTDRIVEGEGKTQRDEVLLVLVLSAAALLREIGTTLVLASAIFFAAHRRFRRALLVLMIPMAVYALWFIRNEILVAGTEFPPLRNSEIFTLHYFTPRDASLLDEFLARASVNLGVYADHVARLLFLPQYGPSVYGVVSTVRAPYSLAASLSSVWFVAGTIISLGAALVGLVFSVRRRASVELLIAFVPIYLLLILLYPFNDVRFLFPLLLFVTAFAVIGLFEVAQRLPSVLQARSAWFAGGLLLLCMLPNAAWLFAYARDAAAYRNSPERFAASVADERPFPDLLTKPMNMVGEWITERTDGPVTVLTQWKELTFSLPRGKLVEVNPLVPLDEFERLIRDYRVGYVVSAVGLADIPEFFPQMELSAEYAFVPVHRVANLEIFEVRRAGDRSISGSGSTGVRGRFADALEMLDAGRPDSAAVILDLMARETRGGNTIALFLAIAHEFRGDLESARRHLAPLQVMKQSGAFLGHAAYHLEIIDFLEKAEKESRPAIKAELLYVVSVKYWNLGFRTQGLAALARALEADPSFGPGLVFGVYYNLEMGRWEDARRHLRRLEVAVPSHSLLPPLHRIVAHTDTIIASKTVRPANVMALAAAYEEAGLGDSAIRELLRLLEFRPQDADVRRSLTDLYKGKRRYAPALRIAEDWLKIDPENNDVRAIRDELMDRW